MNGSPVDMRMNIDETGKIFTRTRDVASSCPEQIFQDAESELNSTRVPRSVPVDIEVVKTTSLSYQYSIVMSDIGHIFRRTHEF